MVNLFMHLIIIIQFTRLTSNVYLNYSIFRETISRKHMKISILCPKSEIEIKRNLRQNRTGIGK